MLFCSNMGHAPNRTRRWLRSSTSDGTPGRPMRSQMLDLRRACALTKPYFALPSIRTVALEADQSAPQHRQWQLSRASAHPDTAQAEVAANQEHTQRFRRQATGGRAEPPRRILLANQPRLLREMLGRVFTTTPGLQVVGEVEEGVNLAAVMGQVQAHWLIVTLDSEAQAHLSNPTQPEQAHPTSLMAISTDGRQIEVQTHTAEGSVHRYILHDVSLAVLLSILV